MKIFAIISIVIVLLLGCCGGCLYTGYYMMFYGSFEPVKVQIEGTPTIDKYIGTIDSGTLAGTIRWRIGARRATNRE